MSLAEHVDLRVRLAQRFDDELRTALDGADEVALVNFPNHGNPGDPAIWLGARASLRRLGVKVKYQCAWCTYHGKTMTKNVPDGPVLLNGGGNFGDLYEGQQGLREKLLKTTKGRRLIQLPQSIHFRDEKNLARNQRLVAEHGDVVLMLREQKSFDFAARRFDAPTKLAPDAALALRELHPPQQAALSDILWLHRLPHDKEYVDHGRLATSRSVEEVEWLRAVDPEPTWSRRNELARSINTRLVAKCRSDSVWARRAWRPLGATFEPYSRGHVNRGLGILKRGRVPITDKLHGHIFAFLADLPHVVMDNSYGKVSGVYDTWTHPSTITRWADDADEALAHAEDLLAAHS